MRHELLGRTEGEHALLVGHRKGLRYLDDALLDDHAAIARVSRRPIRRARSDKLTRNALLEREVATHIDVIDRARDRTRDRTLSTRAA